MIEMFKKSRKNGLKGVLKQIQQRKLDSNGSKLDIQKVATCCGERYALSFQTGMDFACKIQSFGVYSCCHQTPVEFQV